MCGSASKIVRIQLRNPKVPAQVQQIDGAQIPGNRNQRQASRSFRQNNRSPHIYTIQNEPDVGGSVPNRAAVV